VLVGASTSLGEASAFPNPFESAGKMWAAVGLISSIFSMLFLMRAIQKEDDAFWKGIGFAGIVGAGFSIVGSAGKL
jgi:hypothetical protein